MSAAYVTIKSRLPCPVIPRWISFLASVDLDHEVAGSYSARSGREWLLSCLGVPVVLAEKRADMNR
jgi:hypothetical protein